MGGDSRKMFLGGYILWILRGILCNGLKVRGREWWGDYVILLVRNHMILVQPYDTGLQPMIRVPTYDTGSQSYDSALQLYDNRAVHFVGCFDSKNLYAAIFILVQVVKPHAVGRGVYDATYLLFEKTKLSFGKFTFEY